MKGMEGHVVVLMISIVLLIVGVIALWLFLSGQLKFGINLSNLTLKGVTCGICKGLPMGLKDVLCFGQGC